jgi:uncharacterized protein (TIGR02145 family)
MKATKFLFIAAIASALLTCCSKDKGNNSNEQGVLINGVVWAQCNVDAPGAFADKPEAPGRFYQWNRKTGHLSAGAITWDDTNPTGTAWTADNDPSPAGWRVPTKAELEKLIDLAKVNMVGDTRGGIDGVYIIDKTNTNNKIFLPATGFLDVVGVSNNAVIGSYIWSSTHFDDIHAYYLEVFNTSVDEGGNIAADNWKVELMPIRCVKK